MNSAELKAHDEQQYRSSVLDGDCALCGVRAELVPVPPDVWVCPSCAKQTGEKK